MSSHDCVIAALSKITKTPLKYYALVHCSVEESPDPTYYLCLSKHKVIILRQQLDVRDALVRFEFAYTDIRTVVFSSESFDLFAIQTSQVRCTSGPQENFPANSAKQIFCRCEERDRLLMELSVLYKSDYLFQNWKVPPAPLVESSVAANQKVEWGSDTISDAQMDYAANLTEREELQVFRGYQFYCPRAFDLVKDDNRTLPRVTYLSKNKKSFFEIQVNDMDNIDEDAGIPVRLKKVAENKILEFNDLVQDYRIVQKMSRYHRSMNLMADPSSWHCWQVVLRTTGNRHNTAESLRAAKRDICVIVMRREHIPPDMESFQDICLVFFGQQKDPSVKQHAERICDTLFSVSRAYVSDALVDQAKADALLLTEEGYMWYAAQRRIYPSAVRLARLFCKSILRLLGKQVPLDEDGDETHVIPGTTSANVQRTDPLEFAVLLEREPPVPLDNERDWNAWKQRVWRYLAFCTDGGLYPGVLSFETLMEAYEDDNRLRFKIIQLLDTFIYLKSENGAFEQKRVVEKLADDRLMHRATFNHAALGQLLKVNYLKKEINANFPNWAEYPKILVQLLRLTCRDYLEVTTPLQHALCLKFVQYSSRATAEGTMRLMDDDNLNSVVPSLIEFLQSKDDNLRYYAVVALVNLSENNDTVKSMVISGAARLIVKFLDSKHDALVRYSCSLLNNCTKSEQQYRQVVAQFDVIPALMNLLKHGDMELVPDRVPILVQASAVIGNLAEDMQLKKKITECLGYVRVDLEGREAKVPRSILELVEILLDNDSALGNYTESSDSNKDWKSILNITIIVALKNLAYRDEPNKQVIGRLAIAKLVEIARTANPDHEILIDAALRCICILAFNKNNCTLLKMNNVDRVLEMQQARHNEIVKQIILKLSSSSTQ